MSPRERPVGAWNLLSKVFRADELWLRHREEEAQKADAAIRPNVAALRITLLTGLPGQFSSRPSSQ